MIVLLGLVVFLYAFASARNSVRNIAKVQFEINNQSQPFITQDAVSKLLIQNNQAVTSVPKDILDLNRLESTLNSHPIIKDAQVYLSVNDVLTTKIKQKKPIARVQTNASYYIDDEGSYMPLSTSYTARVPLVTGSVEKNNLKTVFKIAKHVQQDSVLKKHVVQIHQDPNKNISLKLRQNDFWVELGGVNQLDKKINNLKVFYKKAQKDKMLNSYAKVNLKFDNQVVCTKK
jgi:cell division protein FtsQ